MRCCYRVLIHAVQCTHSPLPATASSLQSVTDLTEEQAAGVAHLKSGLVDKSNLWMLSEPTWRLLKEW